MIRKGRTSDDVVIVVCNFTPVPRYNYHVGTPKGGFWREILNSDATDYGGSGQGNLGEVESKSISFHGRPFSLTITLPPLASVYFKWQGE
jgi:1,4-alpha-glucan branching enzyme